LSPGTFNVPCKAEPFVAIQYCSLLITVPEIASPVPRALLLLTVPPLLILQLQLLVLLLLLLPFAFRGPH
jgi:hypothetical protein